MHTRSARQHTHASRYILQRRAHCTHTHNSQYRTTNHETHSPRSTSTQPPALPLACAPSRFLLSYYTPTCDQTIRGCDHKTVLTLPTPTRHGPHTDRTTPTPTSLCAQPAVPRVPASRENAHSCPTHAASRVPSRRSPNHPRRRYTRHRTRGVEAVSVQHPGSLTHTARRRGFAHSRPASTTRDATECRRCYAA
jgi:hypothetical protein